MGRAPRCSKDGLNKGAWTAAEDKLLTDYISIHGEGKWSNVAKKTGLKRCGKSCRLRWLNYLRPDIKRGNISDDEEELIMRLHKLLGNRWSLIAGRLPGRTDNEIKNYWNSNLSKKAQDLQLTLPKLRKHQPLLPQMKSCNEPLPVGITSRSFEPTSTNAPAAPHEHRDQSPIENNLVTNDTDQSSDPSLSWASRDDNTSDFLLDFNVEDFCQILDPAAGVTTTAKGSDHATDHNNVTKRDGEDDNTLLKSEASDQFTAKFEENWDTNECVQAAGDLGSSDFMSLVSFLDSGVDWP